MAIAVCGCVVVAEGEGAWIIADVARDCTLGHVLGLRGRIEGEPSRVSGVGACVTIVFALSRTAMLTTPSEAPPRVG